MCVVADDLTGAADAGVAFPAHGYATRLLLAPPPDTVSFPAGEVTVIDAELRGCTESVAQQRISSVLAAVPADATIMVKIDSVMRGHVAAELHAIRATLPDRLLMLAPAFPRLGRVTRGGVQHVDDQPAHEHEIWRLELKPPPREIVALLEGLLGLAVGVDVVRGAVEELAACLRGAAARVVTVDAETDEDLDRLIDGVNASGRHPVWVGSGGFLRRWQELQPPRGRQSTGDAAFEVIWWLSSVVLRQPRSVRPRASRPPKGSPW